MHGGDPSLQPARLTLHHVNLRHFLIWLPGSLTSHISDGIVGCSDREWARQSRTSHKNRVAPAPKLLFMCSRINRDICQQNLVAPFLHTSRAPKKSYPVKKGQARKKRAMPGIPCFSGVASLGAELHNKLRPKAGTSKPVHGEAGNRSLGQAARARIPGQRQQAVIPVLVRREEDALVSGQ